MPCATPRSPSRALPRRSTASPSVHRHRYDHHVRGHVHAVHEQHLHVQRRRAAAASAQLDQLLIRPLHETPTHPGLRCPPALRDAFGQRFQRTPLAPRRHPKHHLLQRPLLQWVLRRPSRTARQRHLVGQRRSAPELHLPRDRGHCEALRARIPNARVHGDRDPCTQHVIAEPFAEGSRESPYERLNRRTRASQFGFKIGRAHV